MSNNDKIKNSIIESIIVISVMVSYIMFGVGILPLLILFIPVPFVVLGVRNGINSNIISTIIVSLMISILIDIPTGASIILIIAPLSVALNYCIKKRKTTMETIIISTGAFFTSFLVLIYLEGKISGINIGNQIEEVFMQGLSMQIDIFVEMGITGDELLETKDYFEGIYRNIIILIPSLFASFSLIVSYVNLLLTSIVLRAMGIGSRNTGKFSKFRLPNNVIPGIGVMLLVGLAFKKLELGYTDAFLLNLTFLTLFVFFLQGLAVVDFLLKKAKIRLFFRILILVINIILLIPAGSILAILGLVDSIFDLRKIRKLQS